MDVSLSQLQSPSSPRCKPQESFPSLLSDHINFRLACSRILFFLCPHFLIPHSYSQTPQMYSAGRAGMNFIQSSLSVVPSFFDLLQGEDRQKHQTSVTRSSAHALSFHVIFHPKLQISSGFLTLQSKYHQQSITVKHPEPEQNHPAAGSSTVVVGGM